MVPHLAVSWVAGEWGHLDHDPYYHDPHCKNVETRTTLNHVDEKAKVVQGATEGAGLGGEAGVHVEDRRAGKVLLEGKVGNCLEGKEDSRSDVRDHVHDEEEAEEDYSSHHGDIHVHTEKGIRKGKAAEGSILEEGEVPHGNLGHVEGNNNEVQRGKVEKSPDYDQVNIETYKDHDDRLEEENEEGEAGNAEQAAVAANHSLYRAHVPLVETGG